MFTLTNKNTEIGVKRDQ